MTKHGGDYFRTAFFCLRYVVLPGAVLSFLACAGSFTQFYPDHFHAVDGIYENKPLGFTLVYKDNWQLFTDPKDMSPGNRAFARELHKNGLELLFVGSTSEGFHGTRAIAANLNEPPLEYAERIRELNLPDNDNDQGLSTFMAGRYYTVKWTYDRAGFRFVEFYLKLGTHNVRVAFWSIPEKFERFLPVYEGIISSLGSGRGFGN